MFAGKSFSGEHVVIEFKGSHFERDVILLAVRWYVAYPIPSVAMTMRQTTR
jgi:transposase-like protein